MAQKGKKKAATSVTIRKWKWSAKQIALDETLKQPSKAKDNSGGPFCTPTTTIARVLKNPFHISRRYTHTPLDLTYNPTKSI
jgi:hypothetical protein